MGKKKNVERHVPNTTIHPSCIEKQPSVLFVLLDWAKKLFTSRPEKGENENNKLHMSIARFAAFGLELKFHLRAGEKKNHTETS